MPKAVVLEVLRRCSDAEKDTEQAQGEKTSKTLYLPGAKDPGPAWRMTLAADTDWANEEVARVAP